MARKVTCPECGKSNDKENTVTHSKRYYCKNCYEAVTNRVEPYKKLIDYICKTYGIESPTGMMLKQIKDYKNDYNFTDEGIRLTLKYYYELMGGTVLEGSGLGIVPYYYEKAKVHFLDSIRIEEAAEEFQEDEKEVVIIKPEVISTIHKKFKRQELTLKDIDWSEIEDE